MEITRHDARRSLLRWGEQVREQVAQRGDALAAEGVGHAISRYQEDRFVLSVLGKAKRGKSTLMNALLGRTDDMVAPIDKLPTSSAITRFGWADLESATAYFRDNHSRTIGFSQVREFVTEECNPGNSKGIELVEVKGPFTGLERDLVLVDTPGAGSIHEHHDVILHAYIPQSDAVIFLVTARMPLDQDELELLRRVKEADISKVFFAINKVDEANERDIEDAVAHNRALIAQLNLPQMPTIYRISARRAFRGDIGSSGLPAMVSEIRQFLASSKSHILDERFKARIHHAAQPVVQSLEVELQIAHKSSAELDVELETLETTKKALDPQQRATEREFQADWDRAVAEYDRNMTRSRSEVVREISNMIDNTTVFGTATLAKELPTAIARSVERHLRPFMDRLHQALDTACLRLQAQYPTLDLQESGEVVLRCHAGHDLITGAVKGVAYFAAGAALTQVVATSAAAMGSIPILGTAAAAVTALVGGPLALMPFGIGLYMAAQGWRLSRVKLKDQLYPATRERVDHLFEDLRFNFLPALQRQGAALVEEFRRGLDRQLLDVEAAIRRAREQRPTPDELDRLKTLLAALKQSLSEKVIAIPG